MTKEVEDVVAIERAIVRLRRSQTRRTLARLSRQRGLGAGPPEAVFLLLDTIDAGACTVSEVAIALGVDQPRASRLVTQAREARLVRRAADQTDGRRSPLVLTPAGRRSLDQVHTFRRKVVTEAIAAWKPDDRAALAGLLTRFVDDIANVSEAEPGHPVA